MDVEILGLLHNAIGPHQDMILARLHGTKPEYSGVVAGMSGSPVYIDGKLLGALAFRMGKRRLAERLAQRLAQLG